jgi:hypothetical protein
LKYRILSQHFGAVRNKLLEYARHFDIAAHGDVKGFGREALVGEFLRSHLPPQIDYLTGEILDPVDQRSGQVDIILQSKRYPRVPLIGNVHLAFADAVVAVIEVKSHLTSQHLNAALGQFRRIKALQRSVVLNKGPMAAELTKIPCVLFAFKGPTKDTLLALISAYAQGNNVSLNDCSPDMVVVLDRSYYLCKNDGWHLPVVPVPGGYFRDWAGLPHESLVGMYNYLNNVIQAHWERSPELELGKYFDNAVQAGAAQG